jgi:hypothetical protein
VPCNPGRLSNLRSSKAGASAELAEAPMSGWRPAGHCALWPHGARRAGTSRPRQGRKHHYRYDPPKAQFYVATTLSWLGERYVVIRPRS